MARTAGKHRATRRSAYLGIATLGAVLVAAALYVLLLSPIPLRSSPQAGSALTPTAAPSATVEGPTTRSPAPSPAPAAANAPVLAPRPAPCPPATLRIPELGVDAPVVTVALDKYGNLGAPSDADKKKAGWFPNGVLAGSDSGTVIMDGHTYHDESAIFRTDFDTEARTGMAVQLSCGDGTSFAYRVTEVKVDLAVGDYAAFVNSRRLYAADGPPQVVIVTCTDWNLARRDYDSRGILIATPAA